MILERERERGGFEMRRLEKVEEKTENRNMARKRRKNPQVKTNLHNSCSASFSNSGFIRTWPLDYSNTQAVAHR